MNPNLIVQEMAIAISVRQHNPNVLTPDFLKYSGIVPEDWELARPPVVSQTAAQVSFKNGVTILAQTNRISFSERIIGKPIEEVTVAAIARQYAAALPQLNYQAVGTSFRGHLPFGRERPSAARDYIFQGLLSSHLQASQMSPQQVSMQLSYRMEDSQMTLEVSEAGLLIEKAIEPVVVFSGNFIRNFKKEESDRISTLSGILDNWKRDLDAYSNLINSQFLPLVVNNSEVRAIA